MAPDPQQPKRLALNAEQRRILRLEPQFIPFLVTSLLPVMVMPYAHSSGGPLQRLVVPVVMTLLVVQSLRTLPRIDSSHRAQIAVRVFQLLGILAAAGTWLDQMPAIWHRHGTQMTVMALMAAFLMFSAVRLVQLLSRVMRVNLQVLAGAAAGYVHLGLTGGVVATLIQHMHPATFALGNYDRHEEMLERLIYFSYVTASSLGYGDVLPTNPFGERFTVLLSISSTLYVSLLVGLVLSRYIATQDLELLDEEAFEEARDGFK